MKYAVGDRVVHPHHGPGMIASIERKELMAGDKRYYVVDIPDQALTILIPVGSMDAAGIRPAMAESRLPKLLSTLRGKPRKLPDDYKARQEEIDAQLRTGRVMQVAKVVRDLTWHEERAHLTRKDSAFLKQGQHLLAAEIALVSGSDIAESSDLIVSTLHASVAGGLA